MIGPAKTKGIDGAITGVLITYVELESRTGGSRVIPVAVGWFVGSIREQVIDRSIIWQTQGDAC